MILSGPAQPRHCKLVHNRLHSLTAPSDCTLLAVFACALILIIAPFAKWPLLVEYAALWTPNVHTLSGALVRSGMWGSTKKVKLSRLHNAQSVEEKNILLEDFLLRNSLSTTSSDHFTALQPQIIHVGLVIRAGFMIDRYTQPNLTLSNLTLSGKISLPSSSALG